MVILGLGSNKGDRMHYLQKAVLALGKIISDIRCSLVYESKALLPEGAPAEWNLDFLNMAICGETSQSPRELLVEIKKIEEKLGRQKTGHWGPREIDIDILAYNDVVMNEPDLVIPHNGLLERDFALVPFADLVPDWVYPGRNITATELARSIPSSIIKMDYKIL